MAHELLELISIWQTGVCERHGRDSPHCGAAKEIATLASTSILGGALGGAVRGEAGAAVGAVAGALVGAWLLARDDEGAPARP